jgi:hypothetical protein
MVTAHVSGLAALFTSRESPTAAIEAAMKRHVDLAYTGPR